jgi:gamma-glutamyltranspeptidase/glutathione hydrolase
MRTYVGKNTLLHHFPLALFVVTLLFAAPLQAGRYVFTVDGTKTLLNGQEILVKGLRCSNALISDESVAELIGNLDTFASYGINTVSVYFMGSRFGDVKGYNEDGSLNPVYAARMGRIIDAADDRGMIVLVGCLYWGNSKGKWDNWTQAQANAAVANTVRWLKEHDYRNVFVDVDNEGMARSAKGFDNRLMVVAGKKADPACVIATNFKGDPPPEADLAIHHSGKAPGKPYIETEATPANAPGGYWGSYSKKDGYYNYINIGLYSEEMKAIQKAATTEHFRNGWGYMCASTWLQCVAPYGPNNAPGGDGSEKSPGVKWWLEYIRETCGPYVPPAAGIGWKASGKGGAVAAGGGGAVAAGISILERGGNAADAATATLLALSITDHGSFAIGAEIPLIIYDARKKEVKVLCGQGGAPLDPNAIKWYYKNGIPAKGGLRTAPVPGALSLCITTAKLYGTMSFEQVVAPALALLDEGKPSPQAPAKGQEWYPNLAAMFRRLIETERQTPGTREQKLQAARDRFYKGDIADELAAYYIKNGGFLRKADLAAHETRVEDPVTVQYRGYTICKCGPWTQGPYLCQTLRLLEGFDLEQMGHLSADYVHVLTEALKLGLADRDEYYGDPLFTDVPLKALLSDQYTRLRRPLIDMTRASNEIRPGDPLAMKAVKGPGTYRPGEGGTTTCVVADRWGNVVAATPSGNRPYAVCSELGVAHGTRLTSLNTTEGHPNRIEPGKRPRITLTPTIVLKDGKAVLAISVAGGDLQDQTTLNCLLNHVEFGMMPEEAVTAPRFSTSHHQDSFDPNSDRKATLARLTPGGLGTLASLTVDDGLDASVRGELARRGHKIETTGKPIAHPVMIYVDPDTGMMYAAGDPKAKRHAAALGKPQP